MFNQIVVLLLVPFFCFADLQLKSVLQKGHKGEFVVAQHQKNYSIWHIKEVKDNHLLLEEITVPMQRVKSLPENGWQGWINSGAPNHVGWVMYTIDLEQGQVTGIFSLRSCTWLSEELANRFLATFLNINMTPVEGRDRRKMRDGSLWNPPLFYDGQEAEGEFDQYITRWPADGSELASKRVEIYLLNSEKYPSFFPYCLQLCGSFGKIAVRIVDSGSGLSTPTNPMWKLGT